MRALPILVSRFAALIIVVLAVHRFGATIPYMQGLSGAGYAIAVGGMLVFPLALAFFLWSAPSSLLGRKLDLSVDETTSFSPIVLSRISVSLLAIWVLAFGFIDLVFFEAEMLASRRYYDSSYSIEPEQFAGRATNIVQIVIGLALWAKRHVLAGLVIGKRDAA